MSRALTLFRLQQTDTRVDRIRARLDSIQKTLQDDVDIKRIISLAAVAESELKELEQRQSKVEDEVKSLRIKIEQIESSLYGGSVRNPKELQDLQIDLASLKRRVSTREDDLLEIMEAVEIAQGKNKEVRVMRDASQRQWTEQNQNFVEEREQLLKDIQKLEIERQAITKSLANDQISIYEQLRQQRQGLAVCGIQDNTCNACGTTLTLSTVQSAYSSGQIIHCPSCGRILYGT